VVIKKWVKEMIRKIVDERIDKHNKNDSETKKLEFLKSLVDIHRIKDDGKQFFLGHDTRNIRDDMDILSRRITNAFEYVTTIMAAHLAQFHTPKKPVGKKKAKK